MIIKLRNNTIQYGSFIKLFTIAWGFGLGSFFVVFGAIAALGSLLVGDYSSALEASIVILAGPAILFFQGPIFGSIAYLGIHIFRKFSNIKFVNE